MLLDRTKQGAADDRWLRAIRRALMPDLQGQQYKGLHLRVAVLTSRDNVRRVLRDFSL